MKAASATQRTAGDLAGPARQRVLAAARACFEKLGIERVTIVDIAEAAKCSRPIVYKHFADKAEIVDTLALEDMAEVQGNLAARSRRGMTYEARLIEAVVQGVILARERPLLQNLLDDRESWLRSQRLGETVRDWVRDRWAAFLRRGIASQLLATDLLLDEVVEWIAMNQSQLLLRYRNEPIDEAKVRHFVERFVVKPLLP